ncbi:glucosamine-6-phosphate deaminase [Cryobacterium sp. TMS1-20-1]|uniref:glucosamine-6-phosphate deaminase n=1 Tax=Cryobacterium sp. TMS1-20-1 TaxID=1259223 RepID=UPI00141B6F21|nr:glucosamine-6-phosphate deaminase [Cryobacterium sp. TMS1-20-1]
MKNLKYNKLDVSIAASNEELGATAAAAFAAAARSALETKDEIAVILATGNSQLSFARAVRERDDIDWSRISILHMDEYLGMSEDHPASFRLWMQENLVQHVHPKAFYGVNGDHVPVEEEIERYSALVRDLDPAICVMGIGENGHLAFNDPPADFDTHEMMRLLDLDDACRNQQVGEGHFASLAETPKQAFSLTVHALLRPQVVFVLTPETRKAAAVKAALEGPVTSMCPGSILQTQPQAHLYLDQDSASLLELA